MMIIDLIVILQKKLNSVQVSWYNIAMRLTKSANCVHKNNL